MVKYLNLNAKRPNDFGSFEHSGLAKRLETAIFNLKTTRLTA